MDFIFAFAVIFISANQGEHSVQTKAHAIQICQKEFPGGRIRKAFPVLITFVNGKQMIAGQVWECMRPVTDKDREKMKPKRKNKFTEKTQQEHISLLSNPKNTIQTGYIVRPVVLSGMDRG